ncbi:MAG: hypothetical protein IPL29_06175 [Propionivibrio sp.]|uniref:lipopolysaccharide kinase InaA family protein n=1 Tax=Propionivibrio sp. TaxID=2212460 RepID=UPI0025CC1A30|nr:lipopolysaccharide kinase InaA family protein [Propionivibrio sp.]MBK8400650.1 hypothetical protein [Propionivibrio sp.]MBL0207009.1 hypothetical protein [Propionivibrio sp.]
MSASPGNPSRPIDAAGLRTAGRRPETPFSVVLPDGSAVLLRRLLRVLPAKRIVGEGEWNGRHVLIKLFVDGHSSRHWTKEKAGINALRQAAILTPDLILASHLPAGGHVLLSAYLDDSQSLAEAWKGVAALPVGDQAALAVLRPAFRLLGSMHAAGLVQDDLHLGNFLRCGDQLFVIDGDAVRAISPGQPLGEEQAASNLAILLAQLPIRWDGCHEALLVAYREGGGRHLVDRSRLESELKHVRSWRLNNFLGKTVRDCSRFAIEQRAFRFSAVWRAEAERLAPLLASPDQAMSQGRLLKDGRTSTVALVVHDSRQLVIKRYNLKNLKHVLERFWRPSRAWHSWREGHRLQFFGIPTPTPLALLEERIGPLRRRAFLVNEFCPGISLQDCLSPDTEPDNEVALAIISLFQDLHDLRISHGDLKASNLLWHDGRVLLIDLDAMVQHRSESGHTRAWRRDRVRLLRNWPSTSVVHRWLDKHLPSATQLNGQKT